MTILYWLTAALAASFTVGVLGVRRRGALRVLLGLNIAASAAGAALFFASLYLAGQAPAQTDSAELLSWAQDAFGLWLRLGGIFTAAVGGTVLLAALIRHKMARVRALAGCAATWLILLAACAYAVTCAGQTLDPSLWVSYSGAGMALLSTAWSIPDLAVRLREEPPQKTKESAKKNGRARNIRR